MANVAPRPQSQITRTQTTKRRAGPFRGRQQAPTVPSRAVIAEPPTRPTPPPPPPSPEQRGLNRLRSASNAQQRREIEAFRRERQAVRQDRRRLANVTPERRAAADLNLQRFTTSGGNVNLVEAVRSGRSDDTLKDAGFTRAQVRTARREADTVDELALIPGAVDRKGNVDLRLALEKGVPAGDLANAGFSRADVAGAMQARRLEVEAKKLKNQTKSVGLIVADAVIPGLWVRNWGKMSKKERALNIALDGLFFIPFVGSGVRVAGKGTAAGARQFGKAVAASQGKRAGARAQAAFTRAATAVKADDAAGLAKAQSEMAQLVGSDAPSVTARIRNIQAVRRLNSKQIQAKNRKIRSKRPDKQSSQTGKRKAQAGRIKPDSPDARGPQAPKRTTPGDSPPGGSGGASGGGVAERSATRRVSAVSIDAPILRPKRTIIERGRASTIRVPAKTGPRQLLGRGKAFGKGRAQSPAIQRQLKRPKTGKTTATKTQRAAATARAGKARRARIAAPLAVPRQLVQPKTGTATSTRIKAQPLNQPTQQTKTKAQPQTSTVTQAATKTVTGSAIRQDPKTDPANKINPVPDPIRQPSPKPEPKRPPAKTPTRAKTTPPKGTPAKPPPKKPPGKKTTKTKPPRFDGDDAPQEVIPLGVTNATVVGYNTGATDRLVNLKTGRSRYVSDDPRIPEIKSRKSFRALKRGKGGKPVTLRGGIVDVRISPKDVRFGRGKKRHKSKAAQARAGGVR